MEKIYEAVSDMILPGVVFAALAAIFIAISLFGRIGKRMETESEDFSCMADTQAVEAVCEREAPRIQCTGKKVWNTGEAIMTDHLFSAADAEGGELDVLIADITDHKGGSVLHCYQENAKQAVFHQSGVYTFSLKAMDREQKISTEKISIIVDDRPKDAAGKEGV